MLYTVLGKRPVSFTANDGKTISGLTVYAGTDIEGEGSVGLACDKFFISTEKLPKADIVVGKDVEIFFNRYGKVDKIVPID